MIRIVADNFVKKDSVESFMELVTKLIQATRQEEGCVSYTLHRDIKDGTHLTLIEEWEDKEAVKRHNNSEHFRTYAPRLAELCDRPGTCFLYSPLDV